MKKYLVSLILVILSCCFLCSCKTGNQITNLVYSNYYENADDFDEIKPAMDLYFSSILSAYEKSNQKKLSSFKLPDSYENAKAKLSSISKSNVDFSSIINSSDTDKLHYLAKLKLLEAYQKIELLLSERDLLLAADSNAVNEEWYDSFDKTVWGYIDMFRREVTE